MFAFSPVEAFKDTLFNFGSGAGNSGKLFFPSSNVEVSNFAAVLLNGIIYMLRAQLQIETILLFFFDIHYVKVQRKEKQINRRYISLHS